MLTVHTQLLWFASLTRWLLSAGCIIFVFVRSYGRQNELIVKSTETELFESNQRDLQYLEYSVIERGAVFPTAVC